MNVYMVGIDFNKASIDTRSKFSFTKKAAEESIVKIREAEEAEGIIILSTCNRMEIWASIEENGSCDYLYRILCREKNVNPDEYRECFTFRKGREATEHLFYLAAGLKSQILAEDQIVTQVSDALMMSRKAYCTDSVLEVLFRKALTAAKKVKTKVVFSKANTSVIHQAVEKLKSEGISLEGKKCMVIGNGAMGRLTALTLMDEGADVTVTVRQYRSGIVEIPKGAERINYGERYTLLPECDLIVSATSSPNYTITKSDFEAAKSDKNSILIDLAVPRDIDPSIKETEGIKFYDVDSFRVTGTTAELEESFDKAGAIIDEEMEEFYNWFSGRDYFHVIHQIKKDAVEDFNSRIQREFRHSDLSDVERERLLNVVNTAGGKIIIKMLFGLREAVDDKIFAECLAGLQEVYDE